MARRLVQLKLRLLRNALHASTAAQVSFLVSTTLAILVAIGTFVVLALFRGQSVSVDVTSVTFTVFAFGWLILPIFALAWTAPSIRPRWRSTRCASARWWWDCWPRRMTAVIMAAVSARALLGPDGHPAFVLGSAVVGAGFVGYFHANSAGLTGPPFVLEAMALTGRRELRSYFSGQNIAPAMTAARGAPGC